MTNNPKIKVSITAADETGKGFAEADKRANKFQSEQDKRRKKSAKAALDAAKGFGLGGIGQGFGLGERAAGGSSFSSAGGGRMRELANAGGALRSAFAAATSEGAGLAEGIGAVGLAAGAASGAVIGLAFGAAKLTESWVRGGAELGRLSAGIGMSTDMLQRWQGAAERFQVSKESMAGSLHDLGYTLNEARFGRDTTALAVMNTIGVRTKYDPNGNIDVNQTALDIADAIARQKILTHRRRSPAISVFRRLCPRFVRDPQR